VSFQQAIYGPATLLLTRFCGCSRKISRGSTHQCVRVLPSSCSSPSNWQVRVDKKAGSTKKGGGTFLETNVFFKIHEPGRRWKEGELCVCCVRSLRYVVSGDWCEVALFVWHMCRRLVYLKFVIVFVVFFAGMNVCVCCVCVHVCDARPLSMLLFERTSVCVWTN